MAIPPFGAPPLPSQTGNSGKFLTTNGTKASWGTSGGQSPWDAIVAPSGGTHTTLGAAIAAASAGWRILVKGAVTEGGATTSSLANLTIVGTRNSGLVTLGSNSLNLSGSNLLIQNVGFSSTTAVITVSGANSEVSGCYFTTASAGSNQYTWSGANIVVANNTFNIANVGVTSSNNYCNFSGVNGTMVGNTVNLSRLDIQTVAARGVFIMNNSGQTFTGNSLVVTTLVAGSNGLIFMNGGNGTVSGNGIYTTATTQAFAIQTNSSFTTITGNAITWGTTAIYQPSNEATISGNIISLNGTSSPVAIDLENGLNIVTGNFISGSGTSSGTAIYVGAGSYNLIANNTVNNIQTAVNVTTGNENMVIGNNFDFGNVTNAVTDSGTATFIKDNNGTYLPDNKDYVVAKNTSGGTINANALVVFKTGVTSGQEITTTTTAGDNTVLGVLNQQTTSTSKGYVQTLGKCQILADGTTAIAVGDYLSAFTTAGVAKKAASGDTAIAISLSAYSTASTGTINAIVVTPRKI